MQLKVLTLTNSVGWVLSLFCLPLAGLLVFAVQSAVRGRPSTERVRQAGGSIFLSQWVMEYGYWILNLPTGLLIRWRISPNAVTLTGLAIVLLGCACAAAGYFGLAGPVILLGSVTDMMDGVIARKRGICSDAGEFVDAMVDRYADIAILGGLAVYYGGRPGAQIIVLMALLGSVMVSYARAKAESLNVHDVPSGPLRRAERAVYLGFGMLFSPLVARFTEAPSARPMYYLELAVCAMIAVIANISAVQMSLYSTRKLGRGAS
jgi:CDP-diacylglycerol--glycerol-3-phosphate 3-phosphatidyltransferase